MATNDDAAMDRLLDAIKDPAAYWEERAARAEHRMALIHEYASGTMGVPRREALRRIKELSGDDGE